MFHKEDLNNCRNNITMESYQCYTQEEINVDVNTYVTHLKSILRVLAVNHSKSIDKHIFQSVDVHSLNREDYKEGFNILYETIDHINKDDVNIELLRKGIDKLCNSSESVLGPVKENMYVASHILQNKLYFNSDRTSVTCKIINKAPRKYIPLVYDVLLCIFHYSTQKLRQIYFHELLDYYYNALEENLHGTGLNISNILPAKTYQELVMKFTPYVKVELAVFNSEEELKSINIGDGDFARTILNFNAPKKYDSIRTRIVEIYHSILYNNLSREDCYRIIRNKIGSNDYEFLNWNIIPLENRGGYLGDYYRLTINIVHNNQKETLNLFAKYLPTYNDSTKKVAELAFEKEELFYDTFLPELVDLGLEEITDFLPKCYFSRINDVIILEDMTFLNYKSFGKGEALAYENILLVTKQLAKIHACTLLYEELMTKKLGKTFRVDDTFDELVKEALLVLDEAGQAPNITGCGVSGTLNYLLDMFPDIPKMMTMDEFKKKLKILYDEMILGKLKSTKFRNVLAHGDPWGNNFLFKRDVYDNPIECCIIDYQLTRYCPPSHDLLFLLYLNTDRKMRMRNMFKIIEQYYIELSLIFRKFGFDLSTIYTYEEFLDSCKMVKPQVIALASIYLQLVLYPNEKLQILLLNQEKFNHLIMVDRKELLEEVYHNDFYRNRIGEIIEDLYEICVERRE